MRIIERIERIERVERVARRYKGKRKRGNVGKRITYNGKRIRDNKSEVCKGGVVLEVRLRRNPPTKAKQYKVQSTMNKVQRKTKKGNTVRIRVIRGKGNKFEVNDRSRIKCGMTRPRQKLIGKDSIQGEDIYLSIPLRNPSITADSVCEVLSESWNYSTKDKGKGVM